MKILKTQVIFKKFSPAAPVGTAGLLKFLKWSTFFARVFGKGSILPTSYLLYLFRKKYQNIRARPRRADYLFLRLITTKFIKQIIQILPMLMIIFKKTSNLTSQSQNTG